MPGTTEGVSLGAAATAAVAGGVYFAKNGEFPSGKSGDGAQGIADRIASITDEEIAHVFGEKVDEIEAAIKEVATDGYNFIAHHKPLAVVVAVLFVVVVLVGILAVGQKNQTKDSANVIENRTSDAAADAAAAVDKADPATLATAEEEGASVSTPPNGEDAAPTDNASAGVASLDDQAEQEAVAAVTPSDIAAAGGGEARPKMKFRSPVKRGKIRSPVRRGKRE